MDLLLKYLDTRDFLLKVTLCLWMRVKTEKLKVEMTSVEEHVEAEEEEVDQH